MSRLRKLVAIVGATATGKTRVSLELSREFDRRGISPFVVSADSVQVYRGMDIGSDKLSIVERQGIPHFLIDVADPDDTWDAARFGREADLVIGDPASGLAPIVAGGTGFYLRTLLWGLFPGPGRNQAVRDRLAAEAEDHGLSALYQRLEKVDPQAAASIHPHDPVRIVRALEVFEVTGRPLSEHFSLHRREQRYDALVIGLAMDRDLMYDRIGRRVDEMMARGLVDEVDKLRGMGYGPELASQQALGYRHIHMMLDGGIGKEDAVELIKRDTRHYSRRQMTWLRKEPGLVWMPADEVKKIVRTALDHMLGESRESFRQGEATPS